MFDHFLKLVKYISFSDIEDKITFMKQLYFIIHELNYLNKILKNVRLKIISEITFAVVMLIILDKIPLS